MAVNDLHLLPYGVGPHEADPPLVIDPDAVLSGTIALDCFEPVAGRSPEVLDGLRWSGLTKLTQCDTMDPWIDRPHALTPPQPFGVFVAERSDRGTNA